jgi:hypothetical protein
VVFADAEDVQTRPIRDLDLVQQVASPLARSGTRPAAGSGMIIAKLSMPISIVLILAPPWRSP